MRVLSYDPDGDFFFVDAAWDEYRQLTAQYDIDAGGYGAGEVIEIQKEYQEELKEMQGEEQFIKDWYGIGDLPQVCLVVKKDLSELRVDQYDYPFHHMWNGESPWIKMKPAAIRDLGELAALVCARRDEANGAEEKEMYNLHWSGNNLTALAVGAFCEHYAKMALLSYGVNIYTPEIDDRGIDFVAEGRKGFLKFQVKGVRGPSQVFMEKDKFDIQDDTMYLILILLMDGKRPDMYLIPACAWRRESRAFVSHNYEGKQSKPDHGVNISKKNMPELAQYKLERMLPSLF